MLREDVQPKELRELVTETKHKDVDINRLFIDGDHWQSGAGWVGPKGQPGEDGYSEMIAELERGFTSSNRIEEASERHASGVVGREPAWGMTTREALAEDEEIGESEQNEIDEKEAATTAWWNERGVLEKLHEAVMNILWGRRSVLRLYVPSGLREMKEPAGTERTLASIMLRMIHLDVISPENGTVHYDPATKRAMGVVLMKNEEDEDVLETSYINEAGQTMIEVVTGDVVDASEPLELGGRITMFELTRRMLITEQVRQLQRAHNLALSVIPRNLTTAGFLATTLINAQMPGEWELDPETREPIRFIPARLRHGSGMMTWLEGIETSDPITGKTVLATPDVKYRDPVDVSPTVDAERATYRTLLEEVQQAHILMSSETDVSGRSRVEARKDYESSLKLTRPVVERAGRWLIETVIVFAEQLLAAGSPSSLERLRCDFNARLDTGTTTPEEREQNNRSVKAGTLPLEYAIAGEGVDDVDAALAIINSQSGVVLDELKYRAEIVKILTDAGASIEAAAEVAGMDPEMVVLLKASAFMGDPEGRGGEEEEDEDEDE